jgi:hypothetical protein
MELLDERWTMLVIRELLGGSWHFTGHEVGVSVTGSLRGMVMIWRGDLEWSQAVRSVVIELRGPERLRRAAPKLFRHRVLRPYHGQR